MFSSLQASRAILWSGACTAVLAAAAAAQPFWTVTDTGNADGIIDFTTGERAILTLWSSCHSGIGFAQSSYDIAGDANWQSNGVIVSMTNIVDDQTFGPGAPGPLNSITGINSNQMPVMFNSHFDPSNPIAIYQIEWEPLVNGSYWATATSVHATHEWYSDTFGTTFSCSPGNAAGSFQVVPAPGALALVGLGVLGAVRRGRR